MDKDSTRLVEVLDYNNEWDHIYKLEENKLKEIYKEIIVNIYHIGSTAIPQIKAKPIIDILIEVKDVQLVDQYNEKMKGIGFQSFGEYGITDRRFFAKGGNNRTHHVHVFQTDNQEIDRHLLFKEYMIANPKDAKAYSELKDKLANEFRYDIESYIQGKDAFIKEIDRKAKEWNKSRNNN